MNAVLVVSHGSHSPKTKQEILALVEALRRRLPGTRVKYAFLEIEGPGIPGGIDQCARDGAKSIIIALNFLNSGRHVDQDVPAIVQAARKKHPHITFHVTKPIGQHPKIPELFADLINNAG